MQNANSMWSVSSISIVPVRLVPKKAKLLVELAMSSWMQSSEAMRKGSDKLALYRMQTVIRAISKNPCWPRVRKLNR